MIETIQSWAQGFTPAHFEVLWLLAACTIGLLFGFLLHKIGFWILKKNLPKEEKGLRIALSKHLRGPSRVLLPNFSILIALSLFTFPSTEGVLEDSLLTLVQGILSQVISIVFILGFSWLILRAFSVLEDFLAFQYDIKQKDNLKARKIHTQMKIVKRVAGVIIGLVALALILLTFEGIQQLGATILASAGVLSIILGFSIQQTLGRLFAGIQLAITQPIRLDDVVIVEGEWGRIEEIALTYAVVKIWDLRRLIVPINYFIENPFQNWTRVSADIWGTVFFYLDYTVPLEPLRQELSRLLKEDPNWDGQVQGIQVTNTTDRHMEVRALMSATDAGKLWDLRCSVREKLISFINTHYPQSFAKIRGEIPFPSLEKE